MAKAFGDTLARTLGAYVAAPVTTLAALKAVAAEDRHANQVVLVTVAGQVSSWRFHGSSALTGDDIAVVAPTAGSGRWLRMPGAAQLVMPFTFATADAAVLWTVPTGCIVQPLEFFWNVTTSFTGGSSSAIGVSSTKTNFTTKGDLLGGAAGDVLATLVSTGAIRKMGTIGAGFDTLAKRRDLWLPADIVRFDRITSAFTAGAGSVVMACNILANEGA